jgi:hypothetical protein
MVDGGPVRLVGEITLDHTEEVDRVPLAVPEPGMYGLLRGIGLLALSVG